MSLSAEAGAGPADAPPPWLLESLVCPHCRGDLESVSGEIVCGQCRTRFPQSAAAAIDLLPAELLAGADRWQTRQAEMQRFFDELAGDLEELIAGVRYDYDPLRPFLESCRGRILDVGGGAGVARHFLPSDIEYLVVEPSLEWLEPRWRGLASAFPCMAQPPLFVRGVAERLPLADRSFDAALLVCTLNHVLRPSTAVEELARILRPDGRAVVVLEDVEPSWRDLWSADYPLRSTGQRLRTAARKLASPLAGWPVGPDHLRIADTEFRRWASPTMAVRQRRWVGIDLEGWAGAYLVYELRRTGCAPGNTGGVDRDG